jgi:hypothetical protein
VSVNRVDIVMPQGQLSPCVDLWDVCGLCSLVPRWKASMAV